MTTLEKIYRIKTAIGLLKEVLDSESMYYADDVMHILEVFVETLQKRLKS